MKLDRPTSKQPIPKQAKQVFSGQIFDVYQWEQEQYDGTFKTFEKIRRADTVSVLAVTIDKKILLTKQEQPSVLQAFYSPVGGVVDLGEEPYEAAVRELAEETGYISHSLELWYSFQGSYKIDWALYMFIAKDCEKTAEQHLDAGEQIEVLCVTFNEFMQIATAEGFRDKELSLRLLREYKNDPNMSETKKILGLHK